MNSASASSEAKQFRRATIYARIVRISLVVLIISFIMFMLLSVPTARAQGAAIQVASLRAALPEYACRRPQYLQSSTTSCLPIHAAKIPNRSCRAMEKRCYRRMMLGQFWLSVRTSFVAVTKPQLGYGIEPSGRSLATQPWHPGGAVNCRRDRHRAPDKIRVVAGDTDPTPTAGAPSPAAGDALQSPLANAL